MDIITKYQKIIDSDSKAISNYNHDFTIFLTKINTDFSIFFAQEMPQQ